MSRPSRAGLPSGPGPRSRSRSAVRARYDDDQRDDSRARRRYDDDARVPGRNSDDSRARRYDDDSQSRQVRPQKSMTSIGQGRSGSQPVLPIPSSRSRHNPTVSSDTRSESSTNRSSDSTTSSASSFLDRMKGYASSRTSLEDAEPPKPTTRSMRSRPSRAETPPPEDDGPGDGYTLWSRVASAASSLTVNVGKAWASNITTFAGEETPVGQESRLTRAMKAYHLEKARDPSDLPPWLFDENERRRPAAEPTRSRRRHDDDDDVDERPVPQAEATRGLRDIYDAAASKSSRVDRSMRGARSYADDSPQPSKATDRLKALRDAKRSAVNPGVVQEEPRAERDRAPEPRRRVGLPSGPVSRRA
ncbi:hypothetical protein GGX14DRAFT_590894 [Mycena pura]|uniref:Uncharacterized protein n=1 Tax=Mycena pura TaxID=153505 RepID=A0AAD6VQU9_9AGAR|nr:hypothetical protein GGX14DRAFT_590894 [Mycena pura]